MQQQAKLHRWHLLHQIYKFKELHWYNITLPGILKSVLLDESILYLTEPTQKMRSPAAK